MSKQEFESTDTKSYTLTILFSFVVMFVLFVLMAQCHGRYKGLHKEQTPTEFNN
jgi:hypothetical protein